MASTLSRLFILFSLAVAVLGAPVPKPDVVGLTTPTQGGTHPSFIGIDSEDVLTGSTDLTEASTEAETQEVTVAARGFATKFMPGAVPNIDKTKFKRGGFFPGFFGPPGKGGGLHIPQGFGCNGPCFFEEPGQKSGVPSNGPPAFGPPGGGAPSGAAFGKGSGGFAPSKGGNH